MRTIALVAVALAAAGLSPALARAAPCAFDKQALSFTGTPTEQARCLLKPVGRWGKLGPPLAELPPTLQRLIGESPMVDHGRLASLLSASGLDPAMLTRPVSRARNGRASAPMARYFVIHDTSTLVGDKPFPADIDSDPAINDVSGLLGPDAIAHAFIDRAGRISIGHDFAVPWRATKREKVIGRRAKGLFLHIENVQPRHRDPSGGPGNDAIAPLPGLSSAQYESLVLLYVVASVRAGNWLIPAFHAPLDDGIPDGHDDPQNFELAKMDAALARLTTALVR